MARAERLAAWLREQIAAAGAGGLVVGLSGGVDSAVVARLAQLATPNAAVGVLMPCHSDPQDERDAVRVAAHLSLPTIRLDLDQPYDALVSAVKAIAPALPSTLRREHPHDEPRARVPLANIKPRLRMTSLYYVANSVNALVAGTGNRSELVVGYFTKYGDGGVDLLPLAHLLKSQVRALAHELGLPDDIVNRTPSAGLWLGQTDEAEMGFTYDELERYLEQGPRDIAPAKAVKIDRLIRASEHKRSMPSVPPHE